MAVHKTEIRIELPSFEQMTELVFERKKQDRKYSNNKFMNEAIAEKIARETKGQ